MIDPIEPEDNESTPEELAAADRKREEALRFMQSLRDSGWIDGETPGEIRHPEDKDLNVWMDPYTSQQFLSIKFAEQLKNMIRDHLGDQQRGR